MNSRIRYSISFIQFILLIASFILMFMWILPAYRQYLNLTQQSYSHIYKFENDVTLDDSYYLLNGTLAYKSDCGSKAELLMQKNVEYSYYSPYSELPALEENEIAVSENLLSLERLSIGDSITLYNPLHATTDEYVIAYSISENYGLLTQTVDSSYGVIVFGYDPRMIEYNDLSSIVFATSDFSASENQLSLDEMYVKDDLLSYCKAQMSRCFIIAAVLQLSIQTLVFAVFCTFSCQRLRKQMVGGSSHNLLYGYIFRNLFWVSGAAMLSAAIICFGIMIVMVGNGLAAFVLLLCNMIELIIMSSLTLLIAKRSL